MQLNIIWQAESNQYLVKYGEGTFEWFMAEPTDSIETIFQTIDDILHPPVGPSADCAYSDNEYIYGENGELDPPHDYEGDGAC